MKKEFGLACDRFYSIIVKMSKERISHFLEGGAEMTEKKDYREEMYKKLLERKEEAKTVRKIVFFTTLTIVVIMLVVGISGFWYVNSALKPLDADSNKQIEVEIPIGSSITTIANILEDKGIIKNATIFRYYVKFNNESGFQAGTYALSPSMTLQQIIKSLKTGKVYQEVKWKLTIPEGLQLVEIAAIIAEKTNQKSEDVFSQLNDPEFIKNLMNKYPALLTEEILDENIKYPLEGYLFPATYPMYEDNPTLEEIVDIMLEKTVEVISEYEDAIIERNLSVHELLTIASLIEEEATAKADRQKIASVFYNRLDAEMPLQTDPTVLYALNKHKDRVLYKDLEVQSPYNTYIHKGLPPGPIANAGKMSIEAALFPADTDYYYFLANAEGEVFYSTTLQEHNELKAKYITNN